MAQYADIVEIVALSQAASGDRVDITVRIKNTYSGAIGIMLVGVPEYEDLPPGLYITFLESSANVDGGATYSFSGYFFMPEKKVTIHAYSYWYGADGSWNLDDEMTKVVNLTASTPQVSDFQIVDFYKV
jgi:hypothetical protein